MNHFTFKDILKDIFIVTILSQKNYQLNLHICTKVAIHTKSLMPLKIHKRIIKKMEVFKFPARKATKSSQN